METIDWTHQHKLEKYEDLREQLVQNGCTTDVIPVKIGCRGFLDNLFSAYQVKFGLSSTRKKWEYIDRVQALERVNSAQILSSSIVMSNEKKLVVSKFTVEASRVGNGEVLTLKPFLTLNLISADGFLGSIYASVFVVAVVSIYYT